MFFILRVHTFPVWWPLPDPLFFRSYTKLAHHPTSGAASPRSTSSNPHSLFTLSLLVLTSVGVLNFSRLALSYLYLVGLGLWLPQDAFWATFVADGAGGLPTTSPWVFFSLPLPTGPLVRLISSRFV
jgi:hypothetical protein